MTPDEKLSAVVAHSLSSTKAHIMPLFSMAHIQPTAGMEEAWDAVAAESYDLFRKTFSDDEIDFIYAQHFTDMAKQVHAKQQTLMGAMFEMGSRLLGPHVEPSDV